MRHGALHFQAAEVARCVAAGLVESPLRPHHETLATLTTMDAIRAEAGDGFAPGVRAPA